MSYVAVVPVAVISQQSVALHQPLIQPPTLVTLLISIFPVERKCKYQPYAPEADKEMPALVLIVANLAVTAEKSFVGTG